MSRKLVKIMIVKSRRWLSMFPKKQDMPDKVREYIEMYEESKRIDALKHYDFNLGTLNQIIFPALAAKKEYVDIPYVELRPPVLGTTNTLIHIRDTIRLIYPYKAEIVNVAPTRKWYDIFSSKSKFIPKYVVRVYLR